MKLKELKIKNFKGIPDEGIVFTDQKSVIARPNGMGKTSYMHAFFWLLDGKDAYNSTSRIKPEKDGEEIHQLLTEVEGIFDNFKLRREMREKWVKPKGQVESEFKGNVTSLFIDNSEVKQNIWNSFLEEKFPIKQVQQPWRLFSSIDYFLGDTLKVNEKNALLMSMAAIPNDEDIARQIDDQLLMMNLSNTDSQKKQLQTEAKREKEVVKDFPGKIQQLSEDMNNFDILPESGMFELSNQLDVINNQIKSTEANISGQVDTSRTKEYNKIQSEIKSLQNDISTIKSTISNEVNDILLLDSDKDVEYRNKKANIDQQIRSSKSSIKECESEIELFEKQRLNLLSSFNREKEFKSNTDSACPSCGQDLPQEKIKEANDEFLKVKNEKLDYIRKKGKEVVSKKGREQAILNKANQDLDKANKELLALNVFIPRKRNDIQGDIESKYSSNLTKLNSSLRKKTQQNLILSTVSPEETDLKNQKNNLTSKRDDINRQLTENEVLKKQLELRKLKLKETEEKYSLANENIATKEYKIILLDKFIKAKNEYISNSVNKFFPSIDFVFTQNYIKGSEREICEALVDGINYNTTNTAAKINAGIEFINSISAFFNISFPIWVDQSESVNSVKETDSQIILLEAIKP